MFSSDSKPEDTNNFMGVNGDLMFLNKVDQDGATYIGWFFGFAFAATSATIISGAVAERTAFRAYIAYSMVTTAFVYPVVAHWGWSSDGWLKVAGREFDANKGYVDFAGSGIVHMVGGCCALVGAILVGPREFMDDGKGGYVPRFDEDGTVNQPVMASSSLPFSTLGTLILWVGWYGFNPGSELAIHGSSLNTMGLATVNTTLGASACAITYFLIAYTRAEPDLGGILNCALAGLVSVTANCNVIEPWAAVVIGIIGAFVYLASSYGLKYMKIDDVIDASPVHFFCGSWGVLATGLFASDELIATNLSGHEAGAFYGGDLFKWQLCGVVVITGWSALITTIFMLPLKMSGNLRIDPEEEKLGLDAYLASQGFLSMTTPDSPKSKSKELKTAVHTDISKDEPTVVLEIEETAPPADGAAVSVGVPPVEESPQAEPCLPSDRMC